MQGTTVAAYALTLAVVLTSCSEPTANQGRVLWTNHAPPTYDGPVLTPADLVGGARDHGEIMVDWPDDPPAYLVDQDSLLEAARVSGGLVYIGFKEPGEPPLRERSVVTHGARRTKGLAATTRGSID